jgi:hypothetical protein
MAALEKVLETYKTGGEFNKQRTQQLGAAEKKYTTGAQAQLTTRGLAGTTIAASIPAAFEQEMGAAFRTETERLRSTQEMNALLAKAGFMESESDRQLKLQMQQTDIEAGKYSSSMDAASRIAAAKYSGGGGGGGGSGGGGGGAFIDSGTGADMWARRTGGGSTGFNSTGGAAQHIGSGGGFSSGAGVSGPVNMLPGVRTGDVDVYAGTNRPIGNQGYTNEAGVYVPPDYSKPFKY